MTESEQIRQLMETMHKLKRLGHYRIDISGLNRGEFSMLMSIHHLKEHRCLEEVQVSDIVDMNKTTMPAISQMLGHLEKKGLIERKPDSKDRRRVSVHLTGKGEQVLDCAFHQFTQFVGLIVERLGEEDTELLIDLFSRLYQIVQEINESGIIDFTGENETC